MNRLIKILPIATALLLVSACGNVTDQDPSSGDSTTQKSSGDTTPSSSPATPSSTPSPTEASETPSEEVTPSASPVVTPSETSEVTPTPSPSEETEVTYSLLDGFNFYGGAHFQTNEEVQKLKQLMNGNCDNKLNDIVCTECHVQPADGDPYSEDHPTYLTLGTGKKAGKISLTFDINIKHVTISVLSYHKYDPEFNTPDSTKVQLNLESSNTSVSAITKQAAVNTITPFDVEIDAKENIDYNKIVIQSIANPKYRVCVAAIQITKK